MCTGGDRTLVETRRLIVERAGHEVVTALSVTATQSACERYRFDVVIIGHALSPQTKHCIFDVIRKHCPTAQVLELCRHHESKSLPEADGWLAVPADVPGELGDKVSALARAAQTTAK